MAASANFAISLTLLHGIATQRRGVLQIVFTVACALAALVVWWLDEEVREARPEHDAIRIFRAPLATWLVIAACIFPTVRVCGYLVDFIVRGLELVFYRMENIHWVLIGTSRALRCATPRCLSFCMLLSQTHEKRICCADAVRPLAEADVDWASW